MSSDESLVFFFGSAQLYSMPAAMQQAPAAFDRPHRRLVWLAAGARSFRFTVETRDANAASL
jgi:hypothetical protein